MLTGLGWVYIQPGESLSLSPSFQVMLDMMSEEDWGVLLLIAGLARFIALFINGSMEAITPWFRVAGSLIGFSLFFTIFSSIISARILEPGIPMSPGLIMYGLPACTEIAAMYLAVIDARIYQNGRRSRSRSASIR